jgi:superfamily I DNA and/or RNA helicase
MLARGKVVVLTLYEAQRSLISGLLEEQGLGDEIGVYNADSFQGQEADVVLISLVVGARASSFAADRRRACVLLSRAKRELLLFGDLGAIVSSPSNRSHRSNATTVWAALAEYCRLHGWVVEHHRDRRRNPRSLVV